MQKEIDTRWELETILIFSMIVMVRGTLDLTMRWATCVWLYYTLTNTDHHPSFLWKGWASHSLNSNRYNVLNCLLIVKIYFRFQKIHLQYITPAFVIIEKTLAYKQCIIKITREHLFQTNLSNKCESFQSKALPGIGSLTLKFSKMHTQCCEIWPFVLKRNTSEVYSHQS